MGRPRRRRSVIFHTVHGFSFHDYQPRPVRKLYIWLERVTTKITTKTVVVSYANAEKGEKAGVFGRKDWVLCRDAIPVDRFLYLALVTKACRMGHRSCETRHRVWWRA